MIKVFTLNENGKIELTKKELEQLLNESYWEGYRNKNCWTYTSPVIPSNPIITLTSTSTNPTIDKKTIICDSNPYTYCDDGK